MKALNPPRFFNLIKLRKKIDLLNGDKLPPYIRVSSLNLPPN